MLRVAPARGVFADVMDGILQGGGLNQFLGGALVANAGHTLRALGVTHVLNCTDDLEDAHAGDFTYHRLPAKDVSEENLSVHFESANAFVAAENVNVD